MAVSDLIKQINQVVENPPAPDAVSEEERVTLLASLEKLRNVVEAPIDFTTRVIFGVSFIQSNYEIPLIILGT